MISSQLEDPVVTHSYYSEYLTKVFDYKECSRTSIFVRYLNINKAASVNHDSNHATLDKFNSGIYFDVYDYTPTYLTNQVVNSSADRQDLVGFKFDGELSITIFTIEEPNINDIILFPYEPHNSEHIFRVKNISTTIKKGFFQLDLEYAPIKNLSNLNYLNNYVYLITRGKNIEAAKYIQIINEYQEIKTLLHNILSWFDSREELYFYIFNNIRISPIKFNRILNSFLSNETQNNRYFDMITKPFGIFNYKLLDDQYGINLDNGQFIYLNDIGLPKVIEDGSLAMDPNFFDANFDYTPYNIDPSIPILIQKFRGFNDL